MSNAAHLLPADVAGAAAALAWARADDWQRRQRYSAAAYLDLLPQDLFEDVVRLAHLAVEGARNAAASPRSRGPLGPADAEALRLELDAGTVLILVRDRRARAAAALSAVAVPAQAFAHGEGAQDLWMAIARRTPAFSALIDPGARPPSAPEAAPPVEAERSLP